MNAPLETQDTCADKLFACGSNRPSANDASRMAEPAANQVPSRKARIAIVGAIGAYWILATLYVMPNNYIRAKAITVMEYYQQVFFQRWEFFAPPATSDYRIYIEAPEEPAAAPVSYELAQPLMEAKRRNAPFNSAETAIDYQLSNSLLAIEVALKEESQNAKRSDSSITDVEAYRRATVAVTSSSSIAMSDVELVRLYCAQAANRLFSTEQRRHYVIRIARRPVAPFRDFVSGRPASSPVPETLILEIPQPP
jgi:hypothetical protein